jgi:hypothetical protein
MPRVDELRRPENYKTYGDGKIRELRLIDEFEVVIEIDGSWLND